MPKRAATRLKEGITPCHRRNWDARFWPYATKGFFAFKERIPDVLAAEGLRGCPPSPLHGARRWGYEARNGANPWSSPIDREPDAPD